MFGFPLLFGADIEYLLGYFHSGSELPSMPRRSGRQAVVRTPKQGRSKATVAAILEAAARILAESGWAGFNTNAVAARAGVSIGSLYEYFPNKQALVDAIAEDHLARGEALLVQAASGLRADTSPADLVDMLVTGLVDLHRDDPRLHRVLSSEVPLSARMRERVETLRAGAVAAVARALAPHLADPGVAAQLLVDTADAVVHRWVVEDDGAPATPERLTAELRRMLRAYLAAAGAE